MIEATTKALAALRAMDAGPLSQGLSPENAAACLNQAIRPLNAISLSAALKRCSIRPQRIGLVVPEGVFTTPVEWTALAASAGCSVHLKAPSSDPALCRALSERFEHEGLNVTWSIDRTLPTVDSIIAFGHDDTVSSIAKNHPDKTVLQYGHRFSFAVVTGDPNHAVGPLAVDVSRYDTRGCMAPTAVFTTGNPEQLMASLAPLMTQMEHRYPRGSIDPGLGPEWRRRIGLANVVGQVKTGPSWAITITPIDHFVPVALPRMVNIHPVKSLDTLRDFMVRYTDWLSTLGTDDPNLQIPGIHRTCQLGWMQAPSIPRNHDGRPMLFGL